MCVCACVYNLCVSVRCSINLQVCCCGCPHKEVYEQHLQGKKHLRVGISVAGQTFAARGRDGPRAANVWPARLGRHVPMTD